MSAVRSILPLPRTTAGLIASRRAGLIGSRFADHQHREKFQSSSTMQHNVRRSWSSHPSYVSHTLIHLFSLIELHNEAAAAAPQVSQSLCQIDTPTHENTNTSDFRRLLPIQFSGKRSFISFIHEINRNRIFDVASSGFCCARQTDWICVLRASRQLVLK